MSSSLLFLNKRKNSATPTVEIDGDGDIDSNNDGNRQQEQQQPEQQQRKVVYTMEEIANASFKMNTASTNLKNFYIELDNAKKELENAQRRYEKAQSGVQIALEKAKTIGEETCDILLQQQQDDNSHDDDDDDDNNSNNADDDGGDPEECSSSWNEKYRELVEYKRQHGHTNLMQNWYDSKKKKQRIREDPNYYNDSVRKLSIWVGHQRQLYRKKQLPYNRIVALQKLEFQWDTVEYQWNKRYRELQQYKAKFGHFNVLSTSEEYKELSGWVRRQRALYNNMIKKKKEEEEGSMTTKTKTTTTDVLTEERYDMLVSIGFEFDRYQNWFNEGFALLKAYKLLHGDCCVPTKNTNNKDSNNHDDENKINSKLVKFVVEVRKHSQKYKGSGEGSVNYKNCLNDERIHQLEMIGFHWTSTDSTWYKNYRKLVEYKAKYGDIARIHHDKTVKGWVSEQRKQFKQHISSSGKSKLDEVKIKQLNDIGFVWSFAYLPELSSHYRQNYEYWKCYPQIETQQQQQQQQQQKKSK